VPFGGLPSPGTLLPFWTPHPEFFVAPHVLLCRPVWGAKLGQLPRQDVKLLLSLLHQLMRSNPTKCRRVIRRPAFLSFAAPFHPDCLLCLLYCCFSLRPPHAHPPHCPLSSPHFFFLSSSLWGIFYPGVSRSIFSRPPLLYAVHSLVFILAACVSWIFHVFGFSRSFSRHIVFIPPKLSACTFPPFLSFPHFFALLLPISLLKSFLSFSFAMVFSLGLPTLVRLGPPPPPHFRLE